MLLNLARSKLGPAMGESTTDRLGSVHFGVGSDGDEFLSSLNVRGDNSSEKVNDGGISGRVQELDVRESLSTELDSGRLEVLLDLRRVFLSVPFDGRPVLSRPDTTWSLRLRQR